MAFNQSQEIDTILEQAQYVGVKGSLGVARWDAVIREVPTSGVIRIPVDFGRFKFPDQSYYVYEEFAGKKMIYLRMLHGGEPFRLGDVHGFFGFSLFRGFTRSFPIIVCEGIADWVALRSIYPYVLCCFTAGVSIKQLFFLRNLTGHIIAAFDNDEAGSKATSRLVDRASRLPGLSVSSISPNGKDFGAMLESEWGREQMNMTFIRILSSLMGGDLYATARRAYSPG